MGGGNDVGAVVGDSGKEARTSRRPMGELKEDSYWKEHHKVSVIKGNTTGCSPRGNEKRETSWEGFWEIMRTGGSIINGGGSED